MSFPVVWKSSVDCRGQIAVEFRLRTGFEFEEFHCHAGFDLNPNATFLGYLSYEEHTGITYR